MFHDFGIKDIRIREKQGENGVVYKMAFVEVKQPTEAISQLGGMNGFQIMSYKQWQAHSLEKAKLKTDFREYSMQKVTKSVQNEEM